MQVEQFHAFLERKHSALEAEIQHKKLRGITPEQYKEIENNFQTVRDGSDVSGVRDVSVVPLRDVSCVRDVRMVDELEAWMRSGRPCNQRTSRTRKRTHLLHRAHGNTVHEAHRTRTSTRTPHRKHHAHRNVTRFGKIVHTESITREYQHIFVSHGLSSMLTSPVPSTRRS